MSTFMAACFTAGLSMALERAFVSWDTIMGTSSILSFRVRISEQFVLTLKHNHGGVNGAGRSHVNGFIEIEIEITIEIEIGLEVPYLFDFV
jgi:hypothetical protein